MSGVHQQIDEDMTEPAIFEAVCAKVIPEDASRTMRNLIGSLVTHAIDMARETTAPAINAEDVLSMVKLAVNEMGRGLRESGSVYEKDSLGFVIFCKGRMGPNHMCSKPDGHKGEHFDAHTGQIWHDLGSGVQFSIEMVQETKAIPVANQDQPSLLAKPRCPSRVERDTVGPRIGTQQCSLEPGHRGKHHDPTTGWFWDVATDGTVLMSKLGEEKGT